MKLYKIAKKKKKKECLTEKKKKKEKLYIVQPYLKSYIHILGYNKN